MEDKYIDETFLARWIAGELTPEELDAFKKTKAYKEFNKINSGAEMLEAPEYDLETSFKQLEGQILIKNQTKTKSLVPRWVYGIAASLLVAFGIFFFMNGGTASYNTAIGAKMTVNLPDNSIVHLNGQSVLTFGKRDWKNNRELNLNGEAFFDVEKGSTFKVMTSQGIVQVVGTEFNVITGENFFEVRCHEGKVSVLSTTNKNLTMLNPGQAFRVENDVETSWNFTQEKPTWLNGRKALLTRLL